MADTQEKLKRFFGQIKEQQKNGPITAQGIRDAAAATGYTPDMVPAILAHAEAWGINPERELAELVAAGDKAKAEAAERLAKEKMILAAGEIEALAGALKTETDPAKIEDLKRAIDLARVKIEAPKTLNPFITFDQYIENLINKNWWEEFAPEIFNRLPFPDGTLSAIGAAPGGGKTAALINICREVLTALPPINPDYEKAQAKNAKRNILFLSAEMNTEAITDRLIQCIAWGIGRDDLRYGLKNVAKPWDYENRVKDIYKGNGELITHNETEAARAELYKQVHDEFIRPAWGKRLQIAYLRGHRSFDEITNIIKTRAEPGTIVLMDYLQLFQPVYKDTLQGGEYCPRYLQIRHVIDEAILAAEQTKSVIICAAQLGRTDRQSGSGKQADDTQGWRESGDIEQSSWNLVKMFLEVNEDNPAEKQMSYRVSKARSSHHLGEAFIIEWEPKYQHMERLGTPKPKKTPWVQRAAEENAKKKKDEAARIAALRQGGSKSGALGESDTDDDRGGYPL
jgi:hypothetical protein